MNTLKPKLEKIMEDNPRSISYEVCDEALSRSREDEEITCFFRDLCNNGCASGMIGSLIYKVDTWKFFNTYYEEIEFLRDDYEQNTGEPLKLRHDLMDFLAWFAFEEVAYRIACDLEIEL